MNAVALLLLALTSTLVLRSGERIVVEGPVVEAKGVVLFRSAGVLYSLPAVEVDRVEKSDQPTGGTQPVRKLRGTEEERRRLLEELEKNHSGKPASPQQVLEKTFPAPSKAEVAEQKREEAWWRRQSRQHDEAVMRSREDLELLHSRADELRSKIQSLVALGYESHQFTWDTSELVRTLDRIPRAELEIQRAERARAQFLEDARREGVMPGWLR